MLESIIITTMLCSMQPQVIAWSGTQASPLSDPADNAQIESIIEINNDFYDALVTAYKNTDKLNESLANLYFCIRLFKANIHYLGGY